MTPTSRTFHVAFHLGGEGQVNLFGYGKGVHVCAQSYHGSGLATSDERDDACVRDLLAHRVAKLPKVRGDER